LPIAEFSFIANVQVGVGPMEINIREIAAAVAQVNISTFLVM